MVRRSNYLEEGCNTFIWVQSAQKAETELSPGRGPGRSLTSRRDVAPQPNGSGTSVWIKPKYDQLSGAQVATC